MSPVLSIIKAITDQTRRIDWCLATHSCTPPLHTSLSSAVSYLPISLQLNTEAYICWDLPPRQVQATEIELFTRIQVSSETGKIHVMFL